MAAKTSCENALFVLLVILHTQCIGMAHLFNGYCVGVWSSGLGLSSGWGHCAVFLGKILCSHSASLHPDVYIDSSEIVRAIIQNAGGRAGFNHVMG